jgi:hypothetical protein
MKKILILALTAFAAVAHAETGMQSTGAVANAVSAPAHGKDSPAEHHLMLSLNAPGCVAKDPSGKPFTGSPGAIMRIPKGSTFSSACFVDR